MKHNAMVHRSGFSAVRHIKGMWDVFFGQGYDQHARVRIWIDKATGKRSIEHLEGIQLTSFHKKLLYKGL